MGDFFMKYKYAILIGMSSLLSGFIPLSITKPKDIVFTIFTTSIPKATQIKEELINFYKSNCYDASYIQIDKKLTNNIKNFKYEATYYDNEVKIIEDECKIKMMGYLYQTTPSFIDFKYYFTGVTNSIPHATSIKVETLTQSE